MTVTNHITQSEEHTCKNHFRNYVEREERPQRQPLRDVTVGSRGTRREHRQSELAVEKGFSISGVVLGTS